MAKPWEKYAKTESSSAPGPWSKYQAPSEPEGPSKLDSLGRGIRQGATFNFADELGGRVQQGADFIAGLLGESITEANAKLREQGFTGDIGPTSSKEFYERARDEERAEDSAAREANPKSYFAGELGGAIGSAFVPGVGIARGAKMANVIGKSTLQGGAQAAGATEEDVLTADGLTDVATGAAIGGGAPIALNAAGKVARGVGRLGKKGFASVTGMSEDLIDHYLKNADRVNAAAPLEEIKDKLDDVYSSRRAASEAAEGALDSAKLRAREAAENFKTSRDAASFDLKNRRFEASRAYDDAKRTADLLPSELDEGLASAVRDLRSDLSRKSADAWEKLPHGGTEKALSSLKGNITRKIKDLKVGGSAVGDQSKSAIDSLQRLRAQLDRIKALTPREAKKVVQNLQRDVDAAGGYGGQMVDAAVKEKRAIAGELNDFLKTNFTEYAEAMKPTAKSAALLSEVGSINDRESARRFLSSIMGKNGDIRVDKLRELEEILGTPGRFTSKIKDASVRLQDADGVLNRMSNPEWAASEMARISDAPVRAAGEAVESALTQTGSAKEALKAVDRINPNRSQAFIERSNPFRSKVNIEDNRFLEELSKNSGTDFSALIKDSAAKQAFEKGNVHGSRNTLFWGALGFLTGGVPGAGAGAAFGHTVMDRYGPKIGKVVLDGMLKAQKAGKSVPQAIQSLNVSDAVRKDLERGVAPIIGRIGAAENSSISRVADESQKGEDRWARRGAEKLGIDPAISERLMRSKDGKRLLIEASDLSPGSKRMRSILEQISKGWENQYGNEPSAVSEAEILRPERRPSSRR